MGDKSKISWRDATWNPIRGCSKVSEGCRNCYAMSVATRFSGPGQPYEGLAKRVNGKAAWTNKVIFVEKHLHDPLRWRAPRMIFVNSMSDLFHPDVPLTWLVDIFAVMALATTHTFQVLTKRPEIMVRLLTDDFRLRVWLQARHIYFITGRWNVQGERAWPDPVNRPDLCPWPLPNVWLGTSCEDQAAADERIPLLLQTPAAVRFVSAEPLLGPIDLDAFLYEDAGPTWAGRNLANPGLDWLIVGGESGPGARPMENDWAVDLLRQCRASDVSFFGKQAGVALAAAYGIGGKGEGPLANTPQEFADLQTVSNLYLEPLSWLNVQEYPR